MQPPTEDDRDPRDEVQKRLAARLDEQGLVRTGRDGKPVRLDVVAGPADSPYYALAGRLLVDVADAAAAEVVLGDLVVAVEVEERLGVAELILKGQDVEGPRTRLLGEGIIAAPHHLLFAVWKGRVYEGEDPELAERPAGPPPPPLPGARVRVAVVDNGVAKEALADAWFAGITVAERDLDPLTVYEQARGTTYLDVGAGHGTFVVGVLRQLAPGCEVVVIRALDSDGIGTELEVARGILRAIDARPHVMNLSLGGLAAGDRPPLLIERAMDRVPGEVVVIAAAGNEGTDRPVWPGAVRRVVSVTATVAAGDDDPSMVATDLETWSNSGWWVDLAAPGTWSSVFVTGEENPALESDEQPEVFTTPFARAAGTSFAAAAVTGAVAAEMQPGELHARPALRRVLARPANLPLPWGGTSVDVWDD